MINRPHCSLVVRDAEPRDIDDVYRVELLSFRSPYPRWYLEVLRALAGTMFLVADYCGLLVGYAVAIPRKSGVCHLASIAVDPKYRRKGIGSALLASIEHVCWSMGYDTVILEVEEGNEPAITLYRLFGYLELGMIPDYYGKGRHAHLMVKPLHPTPEAEDP